MVSIEERAPELCACLTEFYEEVPVLTPSADHWSLFEHVAAAKEHKWAEYHPHFAELPRGVRVSILTQVIRQELDRFKRKASGEQWSPHRLHVAILEAGLSAGTAGGCCEPLADVVRDGPVAAQFEAATTLLSECLVTGCATPMDWLWLPFVEAVRSADLRDRARALDEFQYFGEMATEEVIVAMDAVVREVMRPAEREWAGRILGGAAGHRAAVWSVILSAPHNDVLLYGFLKGLSTLLVPLRAEHVRTLRAWAVDGRVEIRRAVVSALCSQAGSGASRSVLKVLLADESSEIREAAERVRTAWGYDYRLEDPFPDDRRPR